MKDLSKLSTEQLCDRLRKIAAHPTGPSLCREAANRLEKTQATLEAFGYVVDRRKANMTVERLVEILGRVPSDAIVCCEEMYIDHATDSDYEYANIEPSYGTGRIYGDSKERPCLDILPDGGFEVCTETDGCPH